MTPNFTAIKFFFFQVTALTNAIKKRISFGCADTNGPQFAFIRDFYTTKKHLQ